MAKKKVTPSLLDFSEENILEDLSNNPPIEEEEDPIEEEEEEDEDPTPVPKNKAKTKATPKEEEEEEEEEPIEEPKKNNKIGDQNQSEEEEEEDPDQGVKFWEEVSKITGNDVEVDYGSVSPISPQGAALREQAVADRAVQTFLANLEEEYPAVYQALSYAHAGGDIRELYQAEKDYSKIQIADEDEEHAKALLTDYYLKKGFTDARAKRMVAADAESEEGLVGTAKAALAELVQEQQEEQQNKILEQQEQAKRQREQDVKFVSSIDSILKQGRIGTWQIPSKQEAQAFMQYVKSKVQRDGEGGYLLVQRLEPQEIEQHLQAEFLRFKKGDLSAMIEVKARTKNTEKLQLKVQGEKAKMRTTGPNRGTSVQSLKDLDV